MNATKKLYDAGAGRRVRRCIGMRKQSWERLEELCKSLDVKKSELVERLVNAKWREKNAK